MFRTIKHSTPVVLGPGSVDLQSGDFALSASDVSLGSGLTVARNYSSRAPEAGDEGPLGPAWRLNSGNAQSLVELVDGAMMLTDANGRQVLFASLGGGAFESPPGDSNLKLTLEENKTTKQKLYYLEDPAAHTKTKFTLPTGGGIQWIPTSTEGAVGTDTVSYTYQTVPQATEYPISETLGPNAIVTGPDGNLWSIAGSSFITITPTGIVRTRSAAQLLDGLIAGSEGNLWFTDEGHIGKLTPSGKITEYSVPPHGSSEPGDIAQGPEGDIWFTTNFSSAVGKMTPTGVITEYTPDASPGGQKAEPSVIAAGPDGNMWVADIGHNEYHAVWKITPSGGLTRYPTTDTPTWITAGPDGNLWLADANNSKIDKMTTSGVVTEYSLPEKSVPAQIVTGPDRNLWFTESAAHKIGKITTGGAITEYSLSGESWPKGITAGPDGKLWYTRQKDVGTISVSDSVTEPTETLAPVQAGVLCKPEMKRGCRRLTYRYASTTTAKGETPSTWGEYKGRLSRVLFETFTAGGEYMDQTTVAEYSYDSRGELRAEWDPRLSPALKTTYGYDEQGHLTAISPPGQEPWIFTYGTSSGDSGTGRLLKSMRPAAGTALWSGELVAGTGAPVISGTAAVGKRLNATHGTWSGSPLAYGYQWERCAGTQEACVPILGATNASYVPQSADVGHDLAVVVTATNAGGSVTQTAYMTEAVSEGEFKAPHEIIEYPLAAGSRPFGITAGSDGNMWFTESGAGKIGKVTKTGGTQEYSTGSSEPWGITAGTQESKSLWFVEHSGKWLGEIATSGEWELYKVKGSSPQDVGIASGAEGDLWFTESGPGYIAKMTTAGTTAGEYVLPSGSTPYGIVLGGTGHLWFTDYGTSKIGKITSEGAVTEYALPAGSKPYGIAYTGGAAWFTDYGTNKIGEITTAGVITEYALPAGSEPRGIAVGADGRLWVAESGTSELAAVTTSGVVTQYPLPAGSDPYGVALGPEGSTWFTDYGTNKVGKIDSHTFVEETAPEPGTTLDYGVPLSGAGAPVQLGEVEVAKWGQADDPVEGTAIIPPDGPQGWPALSYKRATVYYLDGAGSSGERCHPVEFLLWLGLDD